MLRAIIFIFFMGAALRESTIDSSYTSIALEREGIAIAAIIIGIVGADMPGGAGGGGGILLNCSSYLSNSFCFLCFSSFSID